MAKKSKKKSKGFVTILFFIISLLTSLFAIYEIYLLNSIEDLIRYIVIGLLVIIDFIIFIKVFRNKPKKLFLILFMILYSVICFGLGYFIQYVYGKVDHLTGLKENVILGKLIPAGTGSRMYRDVDYELKKQFMDTDPLEKLEDQFME